MEWLVLGLFLAGLLTCIFCHVSVIWALLAGYGLFFGYGLYKKLTVRQLLMLSWNSLKTVDKILEVMVLIGLLTTAWRAGGTIATIVALSASVISPHAFLILTFLLNALISCLIGTSFGTAATMGVICMSISHFFGIDPFLAGGAILSGIYVGDRCSPLSTSALLVATLTRTNLFDNLKQMFQTALMPVFLTVLVYFGLGAYLSVEETEVDVYSQFAASFDLSPVTLIPAVVIIALSLLRCDVRKTMGLSIVAAFVLAVVVQGMDALSLLPMLVTGYVIDNPALARMLDGGGILSMAQSIAIIAISATYGGIFEKTGLLHGIRDGVAHLNRRLDPFLCVWISSMLVSMISCVQTLAIILTQQVCRDLVPEKQRMMLALEDTVIVSAPCIPWCIAAAVPLATVGAPSLSIAAACYLYLQPLCSWIAWQRK